MEDRLEGGIGRAITTVSNALVQGGTAVDILLKRVRGPYLSQLDPRVRVVPVSTYHRWSGVPAVARYLWSTRPAALVALSERLAAIALRARAVSPGPPRVVVWVQNIDPGWLDITRSSAYEKRRRRIRTTYPRVDRVACVSQGLRDRFVAETGLPDDLVCVVHNPVDPMRVARLAAEDLRHPWFQSGAPPVVLAAARLEPQKDLASLLRAFALLRARRTARLVILGDGRERARLEVLAADLGIADDLQMPGEVVNPYAYMRRARVFALSSLHEGCVCVLIEALAAGLPCVATDCPYSPREILDNGRIGLLTPVGDPAAMADALARSLATAWDAQVLREAATRFHADRIARRMAEVCGVW
jgi:glycosyltransferase involved in cell wall biosynthesis